MIDISIEQAKKALPQISAGLNKYMELIAAFNKVNVAVLTSLLTCELMNGLQFIKIFANGTSLS